MPANGYTFDPSFAVYSTFKPCRRGRKGATCVDTVVFRDNANSIITITSDKNSGIIVSVSVIKDYCFNDLINIGH